MVLLLFIESAWYELTNLHAVRANEDVRKIFVGPRLCWVPRVLMDEPL